MTWPVAVVLVALLLVVAVVSWIGLERHHRRLWERTLNHEMLNRLSSEVAEAQNAARAAGVDAKEALDKAKRVSDQLSASTVAKLR